MLLNSVQLRVCVNISCFCKRLPPNHSRVSKLLVSVVPHPPLVPVKYTRSSKTGIFHASFVACIWYPRHVNRRTPPATTTTSGIHPVAHPGGMEPMALHNIGLADPCCLVRLTLCPSFVCQIVENWYFCIVVSKTLQSFTWTCDGKQCNRA